LVLVGSRVKKGPLTKKALEARANQRKSEEQRKQWTRQERVDYFNRILNQIFSVESFFEEDHADIEGMQFQLEPQAGIPVDPEGRRAPPYQVSVQIPGITGRNIVRDLAELGRFLEDAETKPRSPA
jgi:hypothetical protein